MFSMENKRSLYKSAQKCCQEKNRIYIAKVVIQRVRFPIKLISGIGVTIILDFGIWIAD